MKQIIKYSLFLAALLFLSSCAKNEYFINEVVASPQGLLLDLAFDANGKAYDNSGNLPVKMFSGTQAFTLYNSYYQHYTARFNGTPAQTTGSGFYKIAYNSNQSFKRALADGFSIELLFNPGVLANSTLLSSFIDSKSEGFGVELDKTGEVKFYVATSDGLTTALSRQDTGHAIAVGKYYHVVAVWDYIAQEVRLYIDGTQRQIKSDKSKSLPAKGSILFPSSSAKQWLGLGGAPIDNNNYAGKTFNGEIVRAKIYDKILRGDEIFEMYNKSLYVGAPKQIQITQVAFRSPCKVAEGNRYYVYGDGFQAGDLLVFKSSNGADAFVMETEYNGTDGISAILPNELVSGQYQMCLRRGESEKLLGSVNLELSDTPDFLVNTKILAHRCVHGGNIPENSLAGLRKAREMGLYGAEFDVWVTQPEEGVDNGVVVVNHDKTYEGLSLEKSKYSQLSHLTLSNGESLPTLESFLQEAKSGDIHLTFEIKNHDNPDNSRRCADEILKLIEKYGYTREMFTVTSFNYENLLYLRSKAGVDKLHLAYHGEKSPDELAKDQIDGLAYAMTVFSAHPEWISRAHELKMSTTTWTPSTCEDFTTFLSMGIGTVTVNNVDGAVKYLGRTYLSAE